MNHKRWNYVPTERLLNGENYPGASKYFYVNGKQHPAERTPNDESYSRASEYSM
jgi:hypothetical protein